MSTQAPARRILWLNVMTVVSATILIGVEVFGAAVAGSWAFASLFGLGGTVKYVLDAMFLVGGAFIMYKFVNFARKIEPFSR